MLLTTSDNKSGSGLPTTLVIGIACASAALVSAMAVFGYVLVKGRGVVGAGAGSVGDAVEGPLKPGAAAGSSKQPTKTVPSAAEVLQGARCARVVSCGV